MSCCLKEIKEKSKNESAFNYYQKILTNILAALYKPFGFSCLLSFFALFFYLYAYYPSEAGKGWKAAIHTWFTAFNRIGKSYNDYIADHQMNMFEDFIGYQSSTVLDEPEREAGTTSIPIPQREESENIPSPDLPEQLENVQQSGNEIAERGMQT